VRAEHRRWREGAWLLACGGLACALTLFAPSPAPAHPEAKRGKSAPVRTIELKRIGINQHLRRGVITFLTKRPLPTLRTLKRYPDAARSPQRHLCLAAAGAAVKSRLICVAGQPRRGRIRLGISRLHRSGRAEKLYGIDAKLERRRPRLLKLGFSLRAAGFDVGRFRYFGVSGWGGNSCGEPARGSPATGCTARWPQRGRLRARIREVGRVGCTIGDAGAFTHGPRRRKMIALTFDDGPGQYTLPIMRALDRYGAKATFFALGQEIRGRESTLRKLLKGGHEIGNHTMHHEFYPGSATMRATSELIEHATGFRPCAFRPPGGAFNTATIAAARNLGMSVALWDRDTNDWRLPGSASIERTAISATRGSIVLMHDGGGPRSQTVAALPRIIKTLRGRGYRLVTLTRLLGGRYKLRER
jgi:peptidoglycan-N-acetylglucosamine deacetylase